jgi:hypothetical protein
MLLVAAAGVTALTTLTKLTRLVLQGNGFGIAELALKVHVRERKDAGSSTDCGAGSLCSSWAL